MVKKHYFQIGSDGKFELAHIGNIESLKKDLEKQKKTQLEKGAKHIKDLKLELASVKGEGKQEQIRRLTLELRIESTEKGISDLKTKEAKDVFKFFEIKELNFA